MPVSRRKFIATASALLAGAALAPLSRASGHASVKPVAPLDSAALDALIDSAIGGHNTPGISLAVWQGGHELYARSAGMANLETGTAVAADSVFRIGSLTKQFAGALILKLVDAGELSLDDKASKFLPLFTAQPAFSVRELLSHTAGLHDDENIADIASASQIELAERIAKQPKVFDFEPGSAWLYGNPNYIVIGAIIEKIAAMPLADAAQTLLLAPLGLHRTAFDNAGEVLPGRVSGYSPTESGTPPFVNAGYLDVTQAGAAGAMRSTARELCQWHDALFSGRVVSKRSLAAMTAPGLLRDGRRSSEQRFSEQDKVMGDVQYGFGLFLDRTTKDGSLIVQHHGGINGFAAFLATHVPSRLTYACLCNADTHPGLPFRTLRRSVFRHLLA